MIAWRKATRLLGVVQHFDSRTSFAAELRRDCGVNCCSGLPRSLRKELGMPKIVLECGYVSPFFITDAVHRVAVLVQPYILIHEKPLPGLGPMIHLLQSVLDFGRPLLLIGGEISQEWLKTLVLNKRSGKLQVAAIELPGTRLEVRTTLQDVADKTGGYVFNEKLGIAFDNFSLGMMGTARWAVVTKSNTIISGADGKASDGIKRRGPKPTKMLRVMEGIVAHVRSGQATVDELQAMKHEALALQFDASRETTQKALMAAKAKLASVSQPSNSGKHQHE